MTAWRFALIVSVFLLAVGYWKPDATAGTRIFSGLAAYYSSGKPGLTAAHRTLPFGTRVRVIDPKTGRHVVVTINDRSPFGRHRVIDLSLDAAKMLGMIGRGVIFVRVEVL
jgi:rare lipoprotein A